MMMTLLVFKTKCKEFFEKYYKAIHVVLKMLFTAGVMSLIRSDFPFNPLVEQYHIPLVVGISLLCGCIPDVAAMCLIVCVLLLELSSVSIILAFAFFAILAIYFLLFGRYTKSQSYIVMLISVLGFFNVHYLVPIVAALYFTPAMIPACVVGVLVRYILLGVKEYYIVSQTAVDTGNTMESLQYVFNVVFNNKEMIVYMITFAIAFLLVYLVRKCKFNYASHVGILVGIIVCMSGVILGDIMWATEVDIPKMFGGLLITTIVAYLVQFFRMSLDYMGVRKLQFEDDEYFYYVKAVPKMKITASDKMVTRIEDDTNEFVYDLKDEIEKVLDEDMSTEKK